GGRQLAAGAAAAAERRRLVREAGARHGFAARDRGRLLLAGAGSVAGAGVAARRGSGAARVRFGRTRRDVAAGPRPGQAAGAAHLAGRAARDGAADAVDAVAADALV